MRFALVCDLLVVGSLDYRKAGKGDQKGGVHTRVHCGEVKRSGINAKDLLI